MDDRKVVIDKQLIHSFTRVSSGFARKWEFGDDEEEKKSNLFT